METEAPAIGDPCRPEPGNQGAASDDVSRNLRNSVPFRKCWASHRISPWVFLQ